MKDEKETNKDYADTVGPAASDDGGMRRSSRDRTATKRFEDYELCVTVGKEEEILMMTICIEDDVPSKDDKLKKELIAVTH